MTTVTDPGRERRLLRIQAGSGLVFVAFLIAHLVNTAYAIQGAERYDAVQESMRAVYQQPVVEWLLVLAPLGVHFGAAIQRLRTSGLRRGDQPLRQRLHRYTGWFLLLVILGHVFATRGSSAFFDVVPGFEGLAFSLWWMPWMFYPYYLLLACCGVYHGLNGALIGLAVLGVRVPRVLSEGPGFGLLVGAGALLMLFAVLGIGGHLGPRGPGGAMIDPTDNDYARLYESWGVVELER